MQSPELCGARLAEALERPNADQVQHFGGTGIHAVVEIAQRWGRPALMFTTTIDGTIKHPTNTCAPRFEKPCSIYELDLFAVK